MQSNTLLDKLHFQEIHHKTTTMQTRRTEVLIIGSGFGAAAPALRLSEAGVKVLMIEKGPNIIPEKDFKMTSDPKYFLQYLKTTKSPQFDMMYAEGLGGGSPFYEMVSLRAPSMAFDQRDKHNKLFWGNITRSVMDPYYDLAEKMLHVEQIAEDEIPKTGVVFSYMMKRLGYSCDRARYAVQGCVGSGYCISGCTFGAKQSLLVNYLPQALASGTEILTDIEASFIKPIGFAADRNTETDEMSQIPYRYEVLCKNRKTNEEFTVEAKCIIMGGGTVGTAALLMRSREYLSFLSDHVGKNIAFNGSVKTIGLLAEDLPDADMVTGRTHPGMISYQFLETNGITISAVKSHPIHVVSAARFWEKETNDRPGDWGEAGDQLMKLYRNRMFILYALGLTPPLGKLHLRSNSVIEPELEITEELRHYYKSTKEILNSILTRNGCKLVNFAMLNGEGEDMEKIHFGTTHMIGSARMARNIGEGVIDYNGEVFNYPGIFISDGAAVPTSLAVNSSLTILANAERIASSLVHRFGRKTHSLPILSSH